MSVTVKRNKACLEALQKASKKACWAVCEQIKSDTWNLVPKNQGFLRNTAYIDFTDDGAMIVWDQVYAAYQYEHQATQYTTPGTTDHWVQKVEDSRASVWEKQFAKEMEKEAQ